MGSNPILSVGQKINPNLYRLSNNCLSSSWCGEKNNYFELSYQDREIKEFIRNLFVSQGIWCSRIDISRFRNVLKIKIDLYFSNLLSQKIKLKWTRSYLIKAKQKYKKALKVKNLRNFFKYFLDSKYLVLKKNKVKYVVNSQIKNKVGFGVNRAFKFQLESKKKNRSYKLRSLYQELKAYEERKLISKTSVKKIFTLSKIKGQKSKISFNENKVRLLGTQKESKKIFIKAFKESKIKNLTFFALNNKLARSLQKFTGVENIDFSYSSLQLKYLPTLKIFFRRIIKNLYFFKKKPFFYDSLELIYSTLICYSKSNSKLLGKLLVFLLENNRHQSFIFKFITKVFDTIFKVLPSEVLAIKGIKILIKGRFNKRRRSKKLIFQVGNLSMSKIKSSLSFYQTKAVTIYGVFGVKIWYCGKPSYN